MKIIYDSDMIKYISYIENKSKVKVKDLFRCNKSLCCVVEKKDLRNIIGSRGFMVNKLSDALKKKIKIIGYDSDVREFVKNYLSPLVVDEVEESSGKLIISCKDSKTKGLLIGRERKGLEDLKGVVSRYFDIQEIKVTNYNGK